MTDLAAWANRERETDRLHPLLVIVLCVVVFLEIHPFRDGNGRLSRVPTMLLLLQAGYAYVPYSSLENVVEQNKEAYYMALRQTQGTIRADVPNWPPCPSCNFASWSSPARAKSCLEKSVAAIRRRALLTHLRKSG